MYFFWSFMELGDCDCFPDHYDRPIKPDFKVSFERDHHGHVLYFSPGTHNAPLHG